jgi:hypothetical protein
VKELSNLPTFWIMNLMTMETVVMEGRKEVYEMEAARQGQFGAVKTSLASFSPKMMGWNDVACCTVTALYFVKYDL